MGWDLYQNRSPLTLTVITGIRAATTALFYGAIVYGSWGILTYFFHQLPTPLLFVAGGFVVALQISLQHETIHGHPTPWKRLNSALGGIPLSLYIPYGVYLITHLQHHRVSEITDPRQDPESFYFLPSQYDSFPRWVQWILVANQTLIGRLTLGPMILVIRTLTSEIQELKKGNLERIKHWGIHLLTVALLLYWVVGVCHISLSSYLFFFVYPGISLTLLRSFAEHQTDPHHKSAIVKSNPLFWFVFLGNNFHVFHHQHPHLPWYSVIRLYFSQKESLKSHPYYYSGYFELFKKYGWIPKHSPRFSGTLSEALRGK